MKSFPLTVLLLCGLIAFTQAAEAKTHVRSNGTVDRAKTFRYKFKVTGDGKQSLKATLGVTADKGGARVRIRFFTESPQGGRRELNHLRIQVNGGLDLTSSKFKLPPGEYECDVYVRHSTYKFTLEDSD